MAEIQDIFSKHADDYRRKHRLPPNLIKAIKSIETCRTSLLGGHVDECDECGHIRISYNSCRNRHCPKCQTLTKERWLEARKQDLLPVGYFHVVFTIPEDLNYMALTNQKEVYSILFQAASETLLELGRESKYLGAEIGFTSILHTWGQNLMHHPHVHCVVPNGGLSLDGKRWVNSKKKFFIPVKVLSKVFRGKLLYYLKRAYYNNKLKLIGDNEQLIEKQVFQCFIDRLYRKEWVVYCKPPFGSAEHVLEYLGRYTHRVAISNNRIVFFDNGLVTFKWRDYRYKNKQKFMAVTAEEFIRRFLMHVLPDKFVRIRHYGILSNRKRIIKIGKCKRLLGSVFEVPSSNKLSSEELLFKLTGIDLRICPCCEKGKMLRQRKLQPENYSPPKAERKIS